MLVSIYVCKSEVLIRNGFLARESFSTVARFKSILLRDLQIFRQRLSPQKSVKAYATMPIGIVGRKSLALIDLGSRRLLTRKVKDR